LSLAVSEVDVGRVAHLQGATSDAAGGYTLLLVAPPLSTLINATLYDKLNFNFIRDTTPVAGIIPVPLVLEVNPSVPAKTVPEIIAHAKANSGKLNLASAGNGNASARSSRLLSFRMSAARPFAVSEPTIRSVSYLRRENVSLVASRARVKSLYGMRV
jgi:tripartite-type tricarboxylate transporter receptor subunit TctC